MSQTGLLPLEGALEHPSEMRRATLVRLERAVFELFTQKEFHQVALKDVAAHAHVSLQTIYKYFGGKEQLVAWMINGTLTRLSRRMVEQLKAIEQYELRLSRTLWVMLDYFDKHPLLPQLLARSLPVSQHSDLPVYESAELMDAFLGLFKEGQAQGQLRSDVSSKMLLDVFMGILTRVVLMQTVRREKQTLLERHAVLFDMIWQALRAPNRQAPTPVQK